jgi:hypothetical protein
MLLESDGVTDGPLLEEEDLDGGEEDHAEGGRVEGQGDR